MRRGDRVALPLGWSRRCGARPRCGLTGDREGLRPDGRAPMREGTALFLDEKPVGTVTSGGFGPSVAAPIAMGYVPAALAAAGTLLQGEVRSKRLPVVVADLPFRPSAFKR